MCPSDKALAEITGWLYLSNTVKTSISCSLTTDPSARFIKTVKVIHLSYINLVNEPGKSRFIIRYKFGDKST